MLPLLMLTIISLPAKIFITETFWIYYDFQIFLIIVEYTTKDAISKGKPKTDKVCCQGWHFIYKENIFFFQVQKLKTLICMST